MKRYRFLLTLAAVVITLSASARTKRLTILHTNDAHSCVYPLNPALADTLFAGRGGFLRRIQAVKKQRASDQSLLLIDSGDFSQGSPYYTLFKGDVEVELMNRMHYDVATIGNHEFDFGLENMARLLRKASFPIVCCNYDFTGTPVEGLVKPYVILKKKGLKIGVIGVGVKPNGLVDNRKCEGVKFFDPAPIVLEIATMLKEKKKCDVVICVSHLGWSEKGLNDATLIQNTRCVDLVLGGHSHSFFRKLHYADDLDGKSVPVDQNGKSGIYVGKVEIFLSPKKR